MKDHGVAPIPAINAEEVKVAFILTPDLEDVELLVFNKVGDSASRILFQDAAYPEGDI